MSTARYLGLCALVLAGSFVGSVIANRRIASVHAQAPETTDLRARSVTIVDQQGRTVATLKADAAGGKLVLTGNRSARVEVNGAGSIAIHNLQGRLVWSAPGTGIYPASE